MPRSVALAFDSWLLFRRPHRQEIIVNDGDSPGLRVLNSHTATETRRIAFPTAGPSAAFADAWAIRADGDALWVVDDESQRALYIDLLDASTRETSLPGWPHARGFVYDWRGDDLWLCKPDTATFGRLSPDGQLHEQDPTEALWKNRPWRRATDRIRRLQGVVLRVDPDRGQALIAVDAPTETRIARVGWIEQAEHVITAPRGVIGLASHEDLTVVLYEAEALVLDRSGATLRAIAAPHGTSFVALDTVPAVGSQPATVAFLAADLSGDGTRLVTLPLQGEPGPSPR